MGIRSVGVLTSQRRADTATHNDGGAAAAVRSKTSPAHDGATNALESAVPTEVITLYTAIIAGVTAVEHTGSYLPFRVVIYVVGILATAVTSGGAIRMNTTSKSAKDAYESAEFWTALIAFVAWGMILPGSFLYAWLKGSVLSLTVITVTATATFILAVAAGAKLRQKVSKTPAAKPADPTRQGPPMVPAPPTQPPRSGSLAVTTKPPINDPAAEAASAASTKPPADSQK